MTQYYLALCASLADVHTIGTELTAPGYARAPAEIVAATGGQTNAAVIAFAPAQSNWPSVGWAELWDAPRGGNRYAPLSLVLPVLVTRGQAVRVAAGELLLQPVAAPLGIGRFGIGRYATTWAGTMALVRPWAPVPPCSAGDWQLVPVASGGGSPYDVGAYDVGPYEGYDVSFAGPPAVPCGPGAWVPL